MTTEPQACADNTKDEQPLVDRVDRSVVIGSWLRQVATWAMRFLVIAVACFALWYFMKQFWVGLLPVILALIICTVLATPTTWMRRRGVPNALAAIISILLFFGILGGIVALIAPDIARQSQVLYLQALEGVQRLQLWAQDPPLNLDSGEVNEVITEITAWFQSQSAQIAGTVFSGLSTATGLIITLFMVLVLVVFFLKDGHQFLPWISSVVGQRTGWHLTELLTRAWTTLGGYIRAQATVSLVDAALIGLGLWILNVPMAFTLAVITFVAGFIPYVGAILAGTLAVLVALVAQGFTSAILALALVLLVQQIEGNVLSPLLQSRAMNLHPVVVLISVAIGGGLFGLVGAFLAVPAAAMIAVVFRYLIDVTTLQTGEKTAADINWDTPEGLATGRINEELGAHLRKRWREDGEFYAASQRDFAEVSPTTQTNPGTLTNLLNSSRSTFERLIGNKKNS